MKLILENWRKYLNEGLNYDDYYLTVIPRPGSRTVEYCEDVEEEEECIPYGNIQSYGQIVLTRVSDNQEIMLFAVQSYSGYLSHNEVKKYEDNCYYEKGKDECVTTAIEDHGLHYVEEEIYSGSWTVFHQSLSSKFMAGALAMAFCESVIALLRDELNAEYFGYHQVVHPDAMTTENAKKLAQYAIKKGFLNDVKKWFLPDHEIPENENDYQVYEITKIAEKRFVIKNETPT
ncbi:MAG TPA: hypothetical protein DEO59_11595, partial [Balneola sp.]|jgi:hypothetical protein|nr:hypothetical protein [Balneola sp.]